MHKSTFTPIPRSTVCIVGKTLTNRDGYREYKSGPHICSDCSYREKCTESKSCTKVAARHVWEDDLERVEEQRHTYGIREYYELRKETIERVFAMAKELHGLSRGGWSEY